jgi:CRP/FNR family transcriptional regulator
VKATLGAFALLEEIGEQERLELARYLVERELAAGAELFREGDEADEMLLLSSGRVRLEHDGQPLGAVGRGEVLGALAIIAVGARECDALVEEPTRVLALSRTSYQRLRSECPSAALRLQEAILRTLAGSVRQLLRAPPVELAED